MMIENHALTNHKLIIPGNISARIHVYRDIHILNHPYLLTLLLFYLQVLSLAYSFADLLQSLSRPNKIIDIQIYLSG